MCVTDIQRLDRRRRALPVAVGDWNLRRLVHGVGTRRRVRTKQLIPRYQTPPFQTSSFSTPQPEPWGTERLPLRSYLSKHSPGVRDIVTTAGMYFPNMLDTADEARMAHLRQGAQVHDELFPHLARSVKSESEPFRGTMI